jgi:shikimate 5-dehydrogenase
MIPAGRWRSTRADVLFLGAGGATTAIATSLLRRADTGDRPRRLVAVGRSTRSLGRLRSVIEHIGSSVAVEYVHNQEPTVNDRILRDLPDGSLVVNATGMGKDRPGSPLSDGAVFPKAGIVWDLNYRGELELLRQARAQEALRALSIHDGWRYFIHNWLEHIAEVFGLRIDSATFDRLAAVANDARHE